MKRPIIENLVEQLIKLPGIGRKTAQRLAFFILSMPDEEAKEIGKAIIDVKEKARFCSICFNITDSEICEICSDEKRDRKKICVVEEPKSISVIERTGKYNGLYHVLSGSISPLDGSDPEKVKIRELIKRVSEGDIDEVILATNPNTRGEMTARYIAEKLKPSGIKITRIAYGLPVGSDLEFADEVTLSKSLERRYRMDID